MTNEAAIAFGQRPVMDPEHERRLRVIETARGAWQAWIGDTAAMKVCGDFIKYADNFETTAEKYLKSGEV